MNPILTSIEQEIKAKIEKFAPEVKDAYAKVVLAGDKIMFDTKTHQHMELVKNPESRKDPVNTVSSGVTGLMWVMYQQTKRKMDNRVLIMAGTAILMHAIDFAERGLGITFSQEMIAEAAQKLAYNLFKKLGISPEQIDAAVAEGAKQVQGAQA